MTPLEQIKVAGCPPTLGGVEDFVASPANDETRESALPNSVSML
jgi:hypothetical protein